MCCWRVVSKIVLKKIRPRPAANEPTAIAAVPVGIASSAGGSAIVRRLATATRSGQRGRRRIAKIPPTTLPRPNAVAIVADRAERQPRRDHERVGERGVDAVDPQPRPRAELPPALAQVGEEPGGNARRSGGKANPGEESGADEERDAVDCDRPAGSRQRDDDAGERRAEDREDASSQAHERVRLLQPVGGDELRDQARRGRQEERAAAAVEEDEHQEVPQLRPSGQDEDGEQSLRRRAQQVACEHHALAREPVGPDAAHEHERHERDGARREDEAECRRRRVRVDDRERQRHRQQAVAELRERACEVETPELAFPENPDQPHGRPMLGLVRLEGGRQRHE